MSFVSVTHQALHVCAPRPATVGAGVEVCPGTLDASGLWERIELPYDRIALRTPYGRFLSCQVEEDEGPRLRLSGDLGPQEAFEEVLWPDGEISLRTCELTYLTVLQVGLGSLSALGLDTGPSERFRYAVPPDEVAERAEAIVQGQPQVMAMPQQFAYGSGDQVDTTHFHWRG